MLYHLLVWEELNAFHVLSWFSEDKVLATARGTDRGAVLLLLLRVVNSELEDSISPVHIILWFGQVHADNWDVCQTTLCSCPGILHGTFKHHLSFKSLWIFELQALFGNQVLKIVKNFVLILLYLVDWNIDAWVKVVGIIFLPIEINSFLMKKG